MTVFEPPWVLMPNDFACLPSSTFMAWDFSLYLSWVGSVLSLSILAPSAMFRWEALCEHSPGTAMVASPYLDSTTLSSLISFTKFIIVEHDRLICLFLAASPSLIVDCISSLSSHFSRPQQALNACCRVDEHTWSFCVLSVRILLSCVYFLVIQVKASQAPC